jgi:molybdopterin-guanine dinucleotide biosynthesis protein A
MLSAGFVLAGGRSSRMGRDKALLPYRGSVLLDWIARTVEAAAGSAVIVGDPERYRFLGRPVIADLRSGCGPLAGIEAALSHTPVEHNLIVACDLPGLTVPLLTTLLSEARRSDCDCLLPGSGDRSHDALCAVWRRGSLPTVQQALDSGVRMVAEVLECLRVVRWRAPGGYWKANLNTPDDWRAHLAATPDE